MASARRSEWMRDALLTAYHAMPYLRPAALVLARSGHDLLGHPGDLVGAVEDVLPIDLRIPGRPPTPAQVAEALLEMIDRATNESTDVRRRPMTRSIWLTHRGNSGWAILGSNQ